MCKCVKGSCVIIIDFIIVLWFHSHSHEPDSAHHHLIVKTFALTGSR